MAGATPDRAEPSSGPPEGAPARDHEPVPRRRGLPRPRVLVAAAFAAAVLAGAGAYLLYASDAMRVQKVRVSGTRVLTDREVRQASGVAANTPLAAVDPDAVAASLTTRLPRIASVDVARQWPHTVELTVRERRPAAVVEKGDRYVEVDAHGVRYATVRRAPRGTPLLELRTSDSPGLRRFGADRLRQEAAGVAARLPGELRGRTRAVVVRSYDSITLELSEGRTIAWGSSEHTDVKAKTALVLMKVEPKADHFDVSAPNAPAASGS